MYHYIILVGHEQEAGEKVHIGRGTLTQGDPAWYT